MLDLVHKDLDNPAERMVDILRVNPDGKLSNLFVKLASHATDRTLWVLAFGVLLYAAVRWIEAYGLWHEWEWAQWFALLSTALYLPQELYWLMRHPNWIKGGVLVTNIFILLFMLTLRVKGAGHQELMRSDPVRPAPGSRED